MTIEDGTARVDLSDEFASGGGSLSMQARVAQVVYTLTQFRTVKRVDFWIDGGLVETLGGEGLDLSAGQTRADWEELLPAIFVETPAVGDVITGSRLAVRGSASVFEATFVVEDPRLRRCDRHRQDGDGHRGRPGARRLRGAPRPAAR